MKEASVENPTRQALINYALQFIGNPYVWGGTDPVHGADCSGFAQHVYAQFGIGLPRTSAAQSQYGMKIPVSEAAPGDLIFYAKNGQVYHVVIYIGNGRTVEAASTRSGICSHGVNYANAVWATRFTVLIALHSGQYASRCTEFMHAHKFAPYVSGFL